MCGFFVIYFYAPLCQFIIKALNILSVYFCCLCIRTSGNYLISGEMPIEELMKMYSAAENESTDLQTEEESSQESSDEGGHEV